ncbi:MAG TPA: potassium transporter TrkG [Clostridia bacterium]|nr:potassium transporter TrkG [Clostridia bacterium]
MFLKTWLGFLKKQYNQLRKYPTRILALGFTAVIIVGGFLLWLPFATHRPITLLEAMFTSTSAVCVTGLVVVDTGTRFTLFGQIVLMLLIQTGGLGFMSMATLVMMILGKRITLRDRLVLQEAMGDTGLTGLVRLTRWILGMTLSIEAVGAALLSTSMIPRFGLAKGVYYSVFHSVSAFCNAGFDLMGNYTSLTSFRNDPWTLTVVMLLIVTGGLGYAVIHEW